MMKPVVVVGAGLAGLACARSLHRAGVPVVVLEASDRPGGRVKTDLVDGFRLDRGFHVHFTAYPNAAAELDNEALKLGNFRKGAMVLHGGKLHRIDPDRKLEILLLKLLNLNDKKTLRNYVGMLQETDVSNVRRMADKPMVEALKDAGFSDGLIEKFVRPFFAGVFLDPDLAVSRKQMAFVWKMIADGNVALPAEGIEALARQIADDLPPYLIRTYSRVESLDRQNGRVVGVELDTHEHLEASAVVLATDAPTAAALSGLPTVEGTKSSVCLYFETPTPCVDGAYLVLNATGEGLVNHVAPLSNAQPAYAPAGKHLCSATVLGNPDLNDTELAAKVQKELETWFPTKGVYMWRFLRAYRIRYAQMPQPPGVFGNLPKNETQVPGLFFAGEFTTNGSVDGALESGLACARKLLAERAPEPAGAH